jgi:hypothetical protein
MNENEHGPRAKMLVRVPRDLKIWLESEARRNSSSQAAEVVRSDRIRMEAERRAAG